MSPLHPVTVNLPNYLSLVGLVIGPDLEVGSALLDDPQIPLVSATGSTRMGRIVGPRVAQRFGQPVRADRPVAYE